MASRFKAAGLALALVSTLTMSCTPRPSEDAAAKAKRSELPISGRSALGSFMAGRFAQMHGDTRAAAEYFAAALKHDPENIELLQRAFTLMVAEGRVDESAPLAERLLSFDADAPLPLLVVGIKETRDGRFDQAQTRFAALPKRGVFSLLGPLMAAWSRAAQGQTDQALESLAPLAQVNGLGAVQAFHAALINDLADRAPAAEQDYRLAVADQLSIRAVEAAGSFLQRNGKADKAQELYRRYLAEHPDTMLFDGQRLLQAGPKAMRIIPDAKAGMAEALFDVASVLRQGNAADLSLVFCRLSLALQPDFPLAQLMVADAMASQERLTEANAIYRSVAPGTPVALFGRLRMAMNLHDMGDTDGAMAELDRLAKDQPTGLDALVTKGDILRRSKRFAEAAEAYGAVLARVPKLEAHHWPLLYSRGISYERSQNWAKAEADLLKALELQPNQPDILNYLGYTWVDQGHQLDAARKMIEKAAELRPKDGAIIDSLGWALYRMGDFQGAVKHLERASELKPEDPTINDHLGDALFQVGRVVEAQFQWRRALSLDPEPEQIPPIQEKLRTGRVAAKPLAK